MSISRTPESILSDLKESHKYLHQFIEDNMNNNALLWQKALINANDEVLTEVNRSLESDGNAEFIKFMASPPYNLSMKGCMLAIKYKAIAELYELVVDEKYIILIVNILNSLDDRLLKISSAMLNNDDREAACLADIFEALVKCEDPTNKIMKELAMRMLAIDPDLLVQDNFRLLKFIDSLLCDQNRPILSVFNRLMIDPDDSLVTGYDIRTLYNKIKESIHNEAVFLSLISKIKKLEAYHQEFTREKTPKERQDDFNRALNSLQVQLGKNLQDATVREESGRLGLQCRLYKLGSFILKSHEKMPHKALSADDFFSWREQIEKDYVQAHWDKDYPHLPSHRGIEKFATARNFYFEVIKESLEDIRNFQATYSEFLPEDKPHVFDISTQPDPRPQRLDVDWNVLQSQLKPLKIAIKSLNDYAKSMSGHDTSDGITTKRIAKELEEQFKKLSSTHIKTDFNNAANEISSIYKNNIEFLSTKRDNNWKHIVANIALSITVIGFIAQLINKGVTGNMFFFFSEKTTRQKYADNINEAISQINKITK